jgi:hypothetical protein
MRRTVLAERKLAKYLSKNPSSVPLEPEPGRLFSNAVVIPAMAEREWLPATLESLAGNPPDILARTMILAVINAHTESPESVLENNRLLLEELRAGKHRFGVLSLFWMDACSRPELLLSPKGGVGAARKLGMDAALRFLEFKRDPEPLLFCLDADTLTEPGYLGAAEDFFRANPQRPGAVFPFRHSHGGGPEETRAAELYELHMRLHAARLRAAGSPWAWHALGSAIVCRAAAYAAAGGMKVKNCGEDFYFLQALGKTGPVGEIPGPPARPAARLSDRTPIGTGQKIREIMRDGDLRVSGPAVFETLKILLDTASAAPERLASLPETLDGLGLPEAAAFLRESEFSPAWERIAANTPHDRGSLLRAFHTWFDALATLRMTHCLEAKNPARYPRLGVVEAAGIFLRGFPDADVSGEIRRGAAAALNSY